MLWDLGTLIKDKKRTWHERLQRKFEARGTSAPAGRRKGLKRITKNTEEEEALKQLLEEVRGKKKQQENELWLDFEDYMTSWDPAKKKKREWTSCVPKSGK